MRSVCYDSGMKNGLPETLTESITWYDDYQNCHDTLVRLRWPGGVTCPHCGSHDVTYMPNVRRWRCYADHAAPQFSLRTGTIFADSRVSLSKWMVALRMIVNAKNGISSYEIHRALGVTQKTAWFIGHRIRLALQEGSFERLLDGEVEVDETFIGGKARNMHSDVRARRITGRGPTDKAIVLGMLERGGVVTTLVVGNRRKHTLQREVRASYGGGRRCATATTSPPTRGCSGTTPTRPSTTRSATSRAGVVSHGKSLEDQANYSD